MKRILFTALAACTLLAASAQERKEKKAPPPPPPPPKVEVVAPPPPPPPPPPKVQKKRYARGAAFYQRNPNVKGFRWKEEGKRVEVMLKSGETDLFDWSKPEDRERFKARYGELPPPPPPKVVPPAKTS